MSIFFSLVDSRTPECKEFVAKFTGPTDLRCRVLKVLKGRFRKSNMDRIRFGLATTKMEIAH
jgi:hypothetical protein